MVIDLLDSECSATDGEPSTSNNESKYYCPDMIYDMHDTEKYMETLDEGMYVHFLLS